MNKDCNLAEQKCMPCEGSVLPLSSTEIASFLAQLKNGWQVNSSGHLTKKYLFNDFSSSMNFANKISEVADRNWHHPNLLISWGCCEVEIWTHKINGLSSSDFYLAAKIDELVI